MIRRPPRSTLSSSSAASDVYKRQLDERGYDRLGVLVVHLRQHHVTCLTFDPVSYTHLRAHETPEHLVCRLLLEKKKQKSIKYRLIIIKYLNKKIIAQIKLKD